jgi:16S rRNA (cytosine1402-N4)-methyltransferase
MNYHQPVLLKECIDGLNIRPDGIYVDLTYGGGGHSREILKRIKKGRLITFDHDAEAELNAIKDNKFLFIRSNFRYARNWLYFHGIEMIDGALADLGVSSWHLDQQERGFSFRFNSILDMRMNTSAKLTAREILNNYDLKDITDIFRKYGELSDASRLSASIIKYRKERAFNTVEDLLNAVGSYLPVRYRQKYLAKIFQSLRIEVNDEINALSEMLEQITGMLKSGARFCVITYHSLEDRLVKNLFRSGNLEGEIEKDFYGNPRLLYHQVNRRVIEPGEAEIKKNPRSRSAKLRIGEKI